LPRTGERLTDLLWASSTMILINRNPMVASLVHITHLFSVTPILPMLVVAPATFIDVSARLISPSSAAIKPRYERSSIPMAARKLWPTRPSSRDCTWSERLRYSSDGSASVCKREIIGRGRFGGSLRIDVSEKGRCVVDRPCRVNGRSCRRAASVGFSSLGAAMSLKGSSDGSARVTFFSRLLSKPLRRSSPPVFGRLSCVGRMDIPPGAKASLKAETSVPSSTAPASPLPFRCALPRIQSGAPLLDRSGSVTWCRKYSIAHFWVRTGNVSSREQRLEKRTALSEVSLSRSTSGC